MAEFLQYPKIRIIGSEENAIMWQDPDKIVRVEEKIDGANARVLIMPDGTLTFGSRTQNINPEMAGNWKRWITFVREQFTKYSFKTDVPLILFGEAMLKHSIHYDFEKHDPFILYDMYDINQGTYLSREILSDFANLCGFEMTPIIDRCKVSELGTWDDSRVPQSSFYSGQAEGVVFKIDGINERAKYVTSKFKEVNRESFGLTKKHSTNDDEMIVATFCTNARIDKKIFDLIAEGNKLEMALMGKLIIRVYEDIMTEAWREILIEKKYAVNSKTVHNLVAKRCLAVLKQVITNNSINKGVAQ
jgi:hypothetical protein